MSECKHENSVLHYYMSRVCDCGYKEDLDEKTASNICDEMAIERMVYHQDNAVNILINKLAAEKAARERAEAACVAMRKELEKSKLALDDILSYYGIGLEVANWHKNGDLISLDKFFEDNETFEARDKAAAILSNSGTAGAALLAELESLRREATKVNIQLQKYKTILKEIAEIYEIDEQYGKIYSLESVKAQEALKENNKETNK